MSAAASLLLVFVSAGIGLYVVAWLIVVGWWAWHRRRPATAPGAVSILKPLCGLDEDLERNLASFFELEHDPVQLVFGAADPDDPALALVRRLARRYPGRDVAIVVGHDPTAASPKVGVLESLLPHARHDLILLSDSNVRIAPDDVGRVLAGFSDPRVGMVYQAVVGVGERSLPAAVENLHYTEIAGFLSIAAALFARHHVVNGKGQWLRREALDAIGGTSVPTTTCSPSSSRRLDGGCVSLRCPCGSSIGIGRGGPPPSGTCATRACADGSAHGPIRSNSSSIRCR